MTEGQLETLEKMFPKGFVITYVQPNENMQVLKFIPKENPVLEVVDGMTNKLIDNLLTHFFGSSDEDGEEWKHGGRNNVPS